MKICILTSDMKPPWDEGVKNNAYNIGKRLSKKHHVFYLGIGKQTETCMVGGSRSYIIKSPFFRRSKELFFYPVGKMNLLLKAKKILRREKPDVIISLLEAVSMDVFTGLIKRYHKEVKHIQFVSGDWYTTSAAPIHKVIPRVMFANRFVSKLGLKSADKIIATSIYMKNIVEGLGFKNVSFIPNGVDISKFMSKKYLRGEYKEGFVLSYVGHSTYAKGVPLLLAAFKNLQKKYNMRLLLATVFKPEAIPSDILRDRHITKFGMVRPEIIYNSSDLFVLPRRTSAGTIIYPNVILECMACGVPVLTSRLPGIEELITDRETGVLCKPADAADLERRLEWCINNKNELRRIAKRAQLVIRKRYSWDVVIKDIEKVILSVESK